MTPTPEMPVPASPSPAQDQGKKVVISGMSGLYPRSRYVKDLEHILYNKINPITTEDVRWNYNHPEVAQHAGSVPDLELFDAQFFKVHYRLGSCMDSMARKILENAYEAIYDAGVNPDQLSGKKIGVYIGTCFSETEKACFYMASSRTGFGIAGCSKTMFANRISYWLNAKGPSLSIDDACCSSTAALEQAYLAISRGECEAAIVGGGNLCLHPQSSVHYGRIMTLSKDGTTKSFDQNADGCAKSEAINVLFLQKSSDALRVYADLVHVKTEYVKILDGVTGPRYGFYRDPLDSIKFLYSFYKEAGIPPSVVEYVEAFGSAVPEVDKSELETLDKVFCNGRKGPLLVGSVMSNIGYGEAASGISAVTKVLLGYNRGELAGNLHFDTPRTDVEALREGRIQILQDNTSFGKTYTAVNSMSVTGVNAHVLLHGRYKPKDPNRYKSSIPQLVTLSGRQESSVTRVIEHLKSNPIDYEELGLLRNIHKNRISGHLGRGYIILDTNDQQKTVSLSEKSDYFDDAKRPLWFVYSGMGSQWPEMGTQLMRIPIFAKAIERCRLALEPKGIDIVNIITSTEKDIFDNILHSFVGIAAVQIGLTDVLRELGIVPDNIIGHSVGELGCAYADGCLTAEEMILSAYSRGLVSLETEFIRGSMAAVGVGYQQISKMCPTEIEVACHNGPESSTISGPADVMKQFVAELTDKGIFAKEVPCSNIAYHSRYIAKAGPGLLKYLKEVIPAPKARTERWVSTSVPQNNWSDPAAKYSSAEYHTNNLLSPVLFEETIKLIPSNAVLIEIAPHGLLQAILKRSLPESCINIPLTRRGHPDNARMILDAVGKLYMEGFNPDVQALYPKIEFPVSSGTPMLSHLVDWAHGEKWALPLYVSARRTVAASSKYTISLHDEEYSFLRGHVIRGKTVVPFSFALVAVWDTLAMTMKVPKKELNVQFSNVTFFAEPVLYEQRQIRLSVALHRGQGKFEVMHDNYKIVTGIITSLEDKKNKEEEDSPDQSEDTDDCLITSQEVYQLLCERDYRYRDEFCVIRGINETMTEADLLWNENWVTFIDGLIQFHTLRSQNSTVSRLNFIRNMTIDVSEHNNNIREAENNIKLIKAKAFDVYDRISCGGIIIEHMDVKNVLPLVKNQVDLKTLSFVPRFQSNCDISTSLQVFLQILAENVNKDKIKVVGLMAGTEESSAFVNMRNIAKNNNVAGVNVEYQSIPKFGLQQLHADIIKDADLVLIQNLSNDDSMCQILHKILNSNSFVLNEENVLDNVARTRPSALYSVVAVNNNKNLNVRLELAKWRPTSSSAIASSAFTIRSESDLPLLVNARKTLLPQNGLIILSSYPPVNGLVNLVKQWRAEKTRNAIYLIMVKQGSPKIKGLDELPNMDLAFNVLENGVWGGEYYLPIKETATQVGDVMLVSEQIGNLDSLKWVQVHKQTKPGVPVTVHYAAINMSDVKRATGVTELGSDTSGYGMDFSGTTERGERVMGLVQSGSARSHVIAHPELLWPVPKHWSLEEAATIPLAYTYAYYLLLKVVKFNKDYVSKSILVHGGAGALGQAMINVALANGYKVFATVSNMQKKKFLMRLFPDLKEEYIGCSRDETFADMVLQHTDGIGAGLVVCCVRGDLKNSSFKSCSMFGSIFDMMQIKQDDNFVFGMYHLARARNYMSLDISSIFSNPCIMQQIQLLVAQGIASGFIRPLTRTVYSAQDPQRAFRLLASSSHRGRVLLKFDQSQPQLVNRLACSPDHSHLIVSDGQPLALQFVDTLISRGAKKIYLNLTSQSPPITCKLRSWKNQGVKVKVDTLDLSDESTVCNLLKHLTKSTGFLAGVFIIQSTVTNAMVKIFDTATRKCCPYMKYFLVVSDVASQEPFLNRFSDGLPATCLDISQLEEMQYRGFNRYPQAVDVIERSLCTSYPILKALKKSIPSTSLIQQIANVTNVTLPEGTPEIATLESIGIDLVKSHIVTKFLNDVHNIYIEHDEIPSLTLERVKEIEESLKEIDLKESEGLSTFYSCVDPDELLATTESVMLPTLTNSSTMRDDEFNVNDTHMCIVPGLDGLYARFHTICERLKLPALVLQPGLDHLYEDADHLADRYSKVLLRRTGLNKNFILLGYEFGVIVALKLAAILEENGLSGTVFCIGDGPEETIKRIEAQLQSFKSESALQIAIIKHMCALIGKIDNDVLEKALIGCSTWDQQVKACVRVLLGQVPHSAQYARNLIEAAYVRIKMAREYKAMPKLLQSQIVLIRAGGNSTETSSLQKYSVKPVIIHDIQTPLNQMTNDLRCTAIINKYLPAEVLEAFKNRNLCDTYLLNADTFMTSATDD